MQVIQNARVPISSGAATATAQAAFTVGSPFKIASKNLWRGVNSVVMGAGPAHALHFATYEFCKEQLGAEDESDTLGFAAAGACATFAHDALMTPFDGTYLFSVLDLLACAHPQ